VASGTTRTAPGGAAGAAGGAGATWLLAVTPEAAPLVLTARATTQAVRHCRCADVSAPGRRPLVLPEKDTVFCMS
jgi:hypothetical protein